MITKEELIKFSPMQVRRDKELFNAYLTIYKEEKGRKPNCASCSFASTFTRWANEAQTKKTLIMADNTFTLKNPKRKVLVPFSHGQVLTAFSTDELAIKFLTQKGNGVNLEARRAMFVTLPEGLDKKKAKKIEQSVEGVMDGDLTLAELRERHPEIKARSVKKFKQKLDEKQ
jgi:hypothetical protein